MKNCMLLRFMKKNSRRAFIFKLLLPFKWLIGGRCASAAYWAIDGSARSYILKLIIDASVLAFNSKDGFKILLFPASLYIIAFFCSVFFFRFYEWIRLQLNPALRGHTSMQIMNHMMKDGSEFFQENMMGSIENKVKNLITALPNLLETAIDQIFSNSLSIFIALITLSTIGIQFSIALMVWISFFVFLSFKSLPITKKLSAKASGEQSFMMGNACDVLNNILSVQLFSRHKLEQKKFSKVINKYIAAYQERDWFLIKVFFIQDSSFVCYQGVCLFLLIQGLQKGLITPGDFALVLTINTTILDFLWNFARDLDKLTESVGDIEQSLDMILLTNRDENTNKTREKKLITTEGKITFNNVNFQYSNKEPLFKNESITIQPGQKVGLVGHSGSGKSTFVNLILRLFDVNSGEILIDGQNIQNITKNSLRSSISIIPQNPILFHRSLLENINYGKANATEAEVIAASKKAFAHDFITLLKDKYKTSAGERGTSLSGGQVQRVIIARAILKNAPILILDEATSQLDSVTDNFIQEGLKELMKNKTCLVIAHRLSTLLHMDKILVFNNGVIVASGTHKELLETNEIYKNLWEAQINNYCDIKDSAE